MLNFNSFYWNHCRQLEEYLKYNGFLVDTVSRVDVGDTEFYHIEILGDIPIGLAEFEWESKNFNQDKESNHEQAMRKLEEALKLLK